MCIRDSLRLSPEKVHILVHELRKRGILRALEGPFDLRLDPCLLYTSDAADERSSVDLGGRRIIKKKKNNNNS